MKKLIHISSNIPTSVSIDGQQSFDLSTPKLKWVDVASERDFYISFLPQNSRLYLPVTTLSNNSQTCSVEKIPFYKNHIEIIYSPTQLLSNSKDIILLEKKLGDIYIKLVKNEKTHLCINTSQKELLNAITPDILSVSSETTNYFILKGITSNNTQYVLIINLSTNTIVVNEEFDIIEEDNKNIKLLKFVNDLSKHGIVCVFDKKTMIVDTYSIYKDNSPSLTENHKLIPLAFLESIKYKDFNLAKYYLKDNLVSNEHLISYFGNINKIHYNPYMKDKFINYSIFTDKYKSYNFYIENNKISEIEEVYY